MTQAVRRSGGAPEENGATAASMSRRYWQLDWSKELPWSAEGVSIEIGDFADARPFIETHYPSIFADGSERFLREEMTGAKERFCSEMDVFLFRSAAKTVGICLAHPTDWSTYYIRTVALLPELRERGTAATFGRRIASVLKSAGVQRFEAECSPGNEAMIRTFTSQGMLMTGTGNSERWGATLRFTKFLSADAESVFRRQFLSVPAFGRNPQSEGRRNS